MAKRDLAYIGGGLLSGIGQGLVAEAKGKAARDAARAALDAELARDVRKRDWSREDAKTEREARKGEVQNYVETDEGFVGLTRGGGKVPTGVKGKVGAKDKNLGTDVYAAQWFAAKKAAAEGRDVTADDELEAFQMIRQSKTDPNARKRLILDAMEMIKETDYSGKYEDPQALRQEAEKLVDGLDAPAGKEGGSAKKPGSADTMEVDEEGPGFFGRLFGGGETVEAAPSNERTDKGSAGTQVNPPPAPRDPAKREVNKVYMAPDGRKVEWTGEGWRLVQ